ncbi:MAG: phosphotransferase [Anaerolineae bacterium]|nr:phosphotransferase [Anaerolineae bacterium]
MAIPEIVKIATDHAFGTKAAGVTIALRDPVEFQSNRLYDLWDGDRHFVAKEYLQPNEMQVAPVREHKTLQLLSAMDIAPQPIFFDPSVGPVVIYEYMAGEMWDRRAATADDLAALADIWTRISTAPADWFSRAHECYPPQEMELKFECCVKDYFEWATANFKPGVQAAELCFKVLESRRGAAQELAERPKVLCLCRGDPRFANVIQRPGGRLGLVDWEDSGLHDPAQEAADMVLHPNQEDLVSWETWQAFLEPYIGFHSKNDPEVAFRTHLYLAIVPFLWLTVFLQWGMRLASSGRLAGWAINGLSANARMRRYMARLLAWPDMRYELALPCLESLAFFPEEDTHDV